MLRLRCLRRPTSLTTSRPSALLGPLRPFDAAAAAPTHLQPAPARPISLLSTRRPQLPHALASPAPTAPAPAPAPAPLPLGALDIAPKISTHPALRATQVRAGPRDTYDPSHRVRKRRYGFLARKRSRTGRSVLKRRRAKGRWNMSH